MARLELQKRVCPDNLQELVEALRITGNGSHVMLKEVICCRLFGPDHWTRALSMSHCSEALRHCAQLASQCLRARA
eukprot:1159767-Amphidinium_carterae.1